LYSEVEIQEKQNAVVKTAESGTTTNEDFGRYF